MIGINWNSFAFSIAKEALEKVVTAFLEDIAKNAKNNS